MQHYPGYIIPDEPQPEGFYCLKVFIPADDLYLYAFSGAFQFFGKWLAWERDNAHRGTLAAQAWRQAIQHTFDNGWLNCGDECPECPECPDCPPSPVDGICCNNCGNKIKIIVEIDPCVIAMSKQSGL